MQAEPVGVRVKDVMPTPTQAQRTSPEFEVVWEAIKQWDINVPKYYEGYCGASGSHVALVLNALAGAERRPQASASGVLFEIANGLEGYVKAGGMKGSERIEDDIAFLRKLANDPARFLYEKLLAEPFKTSDGSDDPTRAALVTALNDYLVEERP